MKKTLFIAMWLSLLASLLFGPLNHPSAAQVQTIASGLDNPVSILVDGTYVFWTEGLVNNYVKWTNKGGAAPVYSYPLDYSFHSHSLAQDSSFVYFSLWTPAASPLNVHPNVGAQIVRLPKFAGQIGPQALFQFTNSQIFQGPYAFDIGYFGPLKADLGRVFFAVNNFANSRAEEIRWVSALGASYPDDVRLLGTADQTVEVTCLATDLVSVTWGEKYNPNNNGAIRAAPLVGGLSNTIATLAGYAGSLATPVSGVGGGKIFWLEANPSGPEVVALKVCQTGVAPSTLASNVYPFMTFGNVALAVDALNAYYFKVGSSGMAEVVQLPLAGGSATVLASGITMPAAITVDNAYVYWTEWGSGANTGAVKRVAKISTPNPPPMANFTASPANGPAPLPVQFTDTSTGSITSRYWDFGDGSGSAAANPSHTYDNPGFYGVSLTVTGSLGTTTKRSAIEVSDFLPPVANFTATPTSGRAPLTVQFTDTSTGSIATRIWDFGDGVSTMGQSVSHTYQKPGKYTATLILTGFTGSDSKTATITVRGKPLPFLIHILDD
jgi:PKD repeat protein